MTTASPSRLGLVVALHAALALAYAGLLARDLGARERIVSTDFSAYYTGAALVAGGAGPRLYDAAAQAAMQAKVIAPYRFPGGLMAFLNPPHAALALAPLARLDFVTAFRLWTALQLLFVGLAARALADVVRARAPLARWTAYTAVGAFWPVFYAVQVGQVSPLLLLALLRLYLALEDGADARAGAWLLVLSIKPQLLLLAPILLASSARVRALAWAFLFGAAAFALSGAVLGFAVWKSYVHGLAHLEGFFAQGTPEHMVSLRGLLSLAFGATPTVGYASWGALFVVAVVAENRWRRRPAWPDGTPAFARRFAAAVALTLFFCPHLFVQDVTLWLAPLAIFLRSLADEPTRARAFARFALGWPLAFVVVAAVGGATGRSVAPLALVPPALALVRLVRADKGGAPGAQ